MGSALSLVQALLPEVYITMNGQGINQKNVPKNKKLGIFEEMKLVQ